MLLKTSRARDQARNTPPHPLNLDISTPTALLSSLVNWSTTAALSDCEIEEIFQRQELGSAPLTVRYHRGAQLLSLVAEEVAESGATPHSPVVSCL